MIIFMVSISMVFSGVAIISNNHPVSSVKVSPQVSGKSLIIITFNEEVDPGAKDMFYSALSSVNSTNTAGIVISMNSQGGLLSWGRVIRSGVATGIANIFMVIAFSLVSLNLLNIQNIYSIFFCVFIRDSFLYNCYRINTHI